MTDGKWIAKLTADMPLSQAAHRALQVRLQVVGDCLPRALKESQADPENVHKLRVATRRAGAALRIFADYLPHKTAKRAKKRLRHMRRAAGEARDWDVFVQDLLARRQKAPAAEQAGLGYLLGYAAGRRAAAQTHLHDVGDEDGRHFAPFLAETVAAVRAPDKDKDSLKTLAQSLLARLLNELEKTANDASTNFEQLHPARIAGKRLRYAMELFAGCFDASFKESAYPRIETLQEILGRANDSNVAVERLETIRDQGREALGTAWKTLQPGVTGLLQFHRQRLPRERRAFLTWWEHWRKHSGPALHALIEDVPSGKRDKNAK